MEKYSVIIVDDHKLFREGIELLLNNFDFIGEIYKASDGKEYLKMLETIKPNIVLMDINMPGIDGIEATARTKARFPKIKIIALTMHDSADYYTKMTDAGVDGFVTKNTNSEELKLAIVKVLNNENYFSQKVLENVIRNLNKKKVEYNDYTELFSKREKEVLIEMANGLSNAEISEKLFISHRTVERHKSNMFEKSNCKKGINLILFAIKNKIIEI